MRWPLAFLTMTMMMMVTAQTQQIDITSYEVRYYTPGASAPFQWFAFLSSVVACNQDPPTSTLTQNPSRIVWDDPLASGRVCIYTESVNGLLFSLPVGNYEATLTAFNGYGPSPESARAPFAVGAVAAAPTNVRVIR